MSRHLQHGHVPGSEDERIGRLLWTIRRHERFRQADIATRAGVSRSAVVDLEGGRAGTLRLDAVRRIFEAAGGRARLTVVWHGAAADRLIDARHAALVERTVGHLGGRGWPSDVEVSFSEFGERGSIDVLAWNVRRRAVAVCEIKSEIGSIEETNRALDVKVRLAPKLAADRLGWSPDVIGRILVLAGSSTNRRIVQRHALTFASRYPSTTIETKAWLRRPTTTFSGIWFLSDVSPRDTTTS